jgi:hypothetical protein
MQSKDMLCIVISHYFHAGFISSLAFLYFVFCLHEKKDMGLVREAVDHRHRELAAITGHSHCPV